MPSTDRASASPSAAPTPAQLANAEQDRLDALEEAENAAEDRDGYRLELARVRAQVRYLEAALWTARHEHAEMRARLGAAEAKLAAPKRECECACGCTEQRPPQTPARPRHCPA